MEFLLKKFGISSLQAITFNDKSVARRIDPNLELKFLRTHLMLKLNNGQALECFVSSNGALSIFDNLTDDIAALHELTIILIGKLGLENAIATPLKSGTSAYFFNPNRHTRYFNKDGQSLALLPTAAFMAKVMVRIIGVTLYKSEGGKYFVKPVVYVNQVKVEEKRSCTNFGENCICDL